MTEIVNLVTQFDEIAANNPNYKIIWIKNNKKEIIASTLVDAIYYNEIMGRSVSLTTSKYANIFLNEIGKPVFLHSFINYELAGISRDKNKPIIDHKNGNRLDNTLNNLEIVTYSENNYNREKSSNASSEYHGVSFCKDRSLWACHVRFNGIEHIFHYEIEEHAAYHCNLLIKELGIKKKRLNKIEEPVDFIRKEKKEKKIRDLPKGVYQKNGKGRYKAKYKKKWLGTYDTIEEAQNARLKEKQRCKLAIATEIRNKEILRDENGNAVIPMFDKSKKFVANVIVDDDDEKYHELLLGNWSIHPKQGYARGSMYKDRWEMHRFILNYKGEHIVDHVNGNKLDNRTENLRVATRAENAQNRKSVENSSSQHVGVCWSKKSKKWVAKITINGKGIHLGYFENEEDAARARDVAKRKYHTIGRLNLSE